MDSQEMFRRRLAVITPQDQIIGAFLSGTIASLAEGFKPGVAETVLKAWPPPQGLMQVTKYPGADLMKVMDLAAETAERQEGITYEAAVERMGRGSLRHVYRTSLGKIFAAMMGKDPHRVVSISIISAKAVATWGEKTYEKLGPTSARLHLKREFMGPAWVLGFYREILLLAAGVSTVSLAIEDYQEPGMEFSIRYTW
ncbi:MAG TPA: DUF2378 family protein [Hyalangium sp.]|jgi:uncharacterized protein (TIGR02265 family)|nr:DUF2378 family protein [Hyalangium sp.]